jgi:hypothetical protein
MNVHLLGPARIRHRLTATPGLRVLLRGVLLTELILTHREIISIVIVVLRVPVGGQGTLHPGYDRSRCRWTTPGGTGTSFKRAWRIKV